MKFEVYNYISDVGYGKSGMILIDKSVHFNSPTTVEGELIYYKITITERNAHRRTLDPKCDYGYQEHNKHLLRWLQRPKKKNVMDYLKLMFKL